VISAILRAQFLSMRFGGRTGPIFSIVTGALYYGFWGFVAFGAVMFFAGPDNRPYFLPVLSSGLLFVMLYWQLAPVISAGFGAALDMRKLLAYPIPHRKLFTVELMLRLTGSGEMLLLLGGATIGLLRNPGLGWKIGPFTIAGAAAFATTNILLSAGVRTLVESLFRRTRLKEAIMLLVAMIGLLPQILIFMNVRRSTLLRLAPSGLAWPWAAAARLMLGENVAVSSAVCLLFLAAAYWFGRSQFERSLRIDGSVMKAPERDTRPDRLSERLVRFPARFLPDPLGALVEKELRTLTRIPRFRMVYLMSCVFGIVIYLPALRNSNPHSFGMRTALPIMALYGLLMLGPITYWNAFGFDRSAVQGYFSWPIAFRAALIGKNITVALLLLPQIAMVIVVGASVHVPVSIAKCVETTAVILIASLYWFSMGNIVSVRMPRAMDPEKMNQAANRLQALSIFSAPLLLLPIVLAYWARSIFENELVFAGVLAIAAIVGAIFYKVGLDSAVAASQQRRESMLIQLSKSDGPISAG
jgi:ABC-2 type transport system permease protein